MVNFILTPLISSSESKEKIYDLPFVFSAQDESVISVLHGDSKIFFFLYLNAGKR